MLKGEEGRHTHTHTHTHKQTHTRFKEGTPQAAVREVTHINSLTLRCTHVVSLQITHLNADSHMLAHTITQTHTHTHTHKKSHKKSHTYFYNCLQNIHSFVGVVLLQTQRMHTHAHTLTNLFSLV